MYHCRPLCHPFRLIINPSHVPPQFHSRERNRVHARKTRKHKKVQMEGIQTTIENLQEEGRRMRLAVTEWYTANILLVMRGPEAEKEEAGAEVAAASAGDEEDSNSSPPAPPPITSTKCESNSSSDSNSNRSSRTSDGLLNKYMNVQAFLERTNAAAAANNKAYDEAQNRAASENGFGDDTSSVGDLEEEEGKAGGVGVRGRCKYAPEDRERIRRERNRIHAKRTRDRRKKFMEESEKVMTRLMKENEELRQMLDLIYGDRAPPGVAQQQHLVGGCQMLPYHQQQQQQQHQQQQLLMLQRSVGEGESSVASSSNSTSSASSTATGSGGVKKDKTSSGASHGSTTKRKQRPQHQHREEVDGSEGSEQEGLGEEEQLEEELEEEDDNDDEGSDDGGEGHEGKAPGGTVSKQLSPRWSEVPPSQVGEHWATSRPHLASSSPRYFGGTAISPLSVAPYPPPPPHLGLSSGSCNNHHHGATASPHTSTEQQQQQNGTSMMRAIGPMVGGGMGILPGGAGGGGLEMKVEPSGVEAV